MNGHANTRPQAGVVGAGIAGLCAAIALRRAGWDVEIFERSRFKHETGAAISVTPNATNILEHLGFDFEKAQPVPNEQLRMKLAPDFATIVTQQFPDLKEQFGYTSWSFHRVDLHRGLRDLALDPDTSKGQVCNIRLGSEVKAVDFEAGVLELEDGTKIQKALVVIADGAHSHLVEQFTGTTDSFTAVGRSIYRWLVPIERIMADDDVRPLYKDELPGFLGIADPPGKNLCISYTCRGGSVLNCAFVHDTKRDQDETDIWNSPATPEQVHETAKNYNPTFHKLIDMAGEDGIKVHHLLHRPAMSTFTRGRGLVVGDAAHVMIPTHAAGGSVAIESAAAIEVLFRTQSLPDTNAETIAQRLALFDKLRIPRCNMTMLLSNAGPPGLAIPGVEQEIRKYYDGPLPPPGCIPWTAPLREIMFDYDGYAVAEKELANVVSVEA